MLDVLPFVFLGVLLGTFTGLVPGIHVNTVVIVLLALLPSLLSNFSPYSIAALVIAMSVVHSYVDYIPSIFLGAPAEDSVLSVLPGHRLLLKGRGYEAVRLTVVGGLGATIFSLAVLSFGLAVLPLLYSQIASLVPYLLIGVLLFIVWVQNRDRWLYAAVAVLYSGILGILILDLGVISLKYALFPALTGLFGISTLFVSLRSRVEIPPQSLGWSQVQYRKGVTIGSLAGLLAGLLPSIGSSQSATVIQGLFGRGDEKEFLVALGGVNTANSIYAFLALYLIGRSRSGASIAVKEIMDVPSFPDLLFMVSIVLFTTFFAVFITLELAKLFAGVVQKLDYKLFSRAIIAFLAILVAFLTGWKGLLILVTASAIGIFVQMAGVNRSSCMAVLIVPTIIYFLG
ncbi:MAG: tripartite tricarboxylate transporter permease [Candidatus Hydrothermarchaeales archaeon]